jgi:hypothetical protein
MIIMIKNEKILLIINQLVIIEDINLYKFYEIKIKGLFSESILMFISYIT